MIHRWKTIASELLVGTPIFNVFRELRRGGDQEAPFYTMKLPDWVNVMALTEGGELVLVRQFRHGTDEITLEIPGGNVDDGETSRQAAIRELREETGFEAEEWHHIGCVEPNPAFMGNRCDTYLGVGAARTVEPNPDEHEELEVVLVEREDFDAKIATGEVSHALVVAAAFHLRQWEDDGP